MYELGAWFIWLLDVAILAILAFFAIVFTFIKRNQYAKDAISKILIEIQLPTGWSEYHIVLVDDNAKTVTMDSFIYMLNLEKRRHAKYPRVPFMGLSWLQVPIRTESWAKDNPEPIQPSYTVIDGEKVIYYDTDEDGNKVVTKSLVATSREIKAIEDEHTAVATAMEIQEMHAQQKALVDAITNQPNKTIVYIGLGLSALASIVCVIILAQLAGVAGG